MARFLSLLELFREGAVAFDQVTPLGELTVRWTGAEDGEVEITDEFDGAPPEDDGTSSPSDEADDRRTAAGGRRDRADRAEAPETDVDTLAVAVAELRPALEAMLMVADQPLDKVRLASAVGHPVGRRRGRAAGARRGVRRAGPRLRAAQRRRRLALLHPRGVRRGRRGLRARGPAGPAHPGGAGDARVVAYKQPVSRARVSAIRGVNVDGVMRTLLTRGLVEEAGQDGDSGANLYRTTAYFLERIGMTSLDELPELAPYLPDMDDLEDELASVAGLDAAPEPAPSARARRPRPARTHRGTPRPTAAGHRARRRDRGHASKPHDCSRDTRPTPPPTARSPTTTG